MTQINFNAVELSLIYNCIEQLIKYQQLGTLEEVQEAVEKQKTKKIDIWNGQASCPTCRSVYGNMKDIKKLMCWKFPHCKWCGQRLDWRE